MTTRLSHAITFATMAHSGQIDKVGLPVILHPLRVMGAVALAHPENEDAQIVAVLHDVVEDTSIPLDHVEMIFGKAVRDGVDAVTRRVFDAELRPEDRRKEPYEAFIQRVRQNALGRLVKVFDLHDNINRPSPPEMKGIARRYYRALAELS